MTKKIIRTCKMTLCFLLLLPGLAAHSQSLQVPSTLKQAPFDASAFQSSLTEQSQLTRELRQLASELLNNASAVDDLQVKMALQAICGKYQEALSTLNQIRRQQQTSEPFPDPFFGFHYELFLKSKLRQSEKQTGLETTLSQVFNEIFLSLNNKQAYQASYYSSYSLEQGIPYMQWLFEQAASAQEFSNEMAANLVRQYQDYFVYHQVLPPSKPLLAKDNDRRYHIDDQVLINTPEGATLSATVVRDKTISARQPTALMFNIYTFESFNVREAIHAASHGYVGIVADTRGKRLSPDKIMPYEHEVKDVNAVIDWISKQSWSDGQVGMYGGSYSGFAQWAAAKNPHPALKTIVPYVAAIPGQGLPMENNIFLNANYGWAFYVSNNRTLDVDTYFDRQRWDDLNENWFKSGRPYRQIDQVDGTPNHLLQRWLSHPGYDEYWQNMVPYQQDYAKINIPVLSITGYYDDGQISALHYLNEHYRYNENANHYLLIGPYDHRTAQGRPGAVLRGYTLDPSAFIDTPEITFEWLDHVLKGAKKPSLIKDKINYQVMGDDSWRHTDSLALVNAQTRRFYLGSAKSGDYRSFNTKQASQVDFVSQQVDLADRETSNNDYYPWPIIREKLEIPNGVAYVSPAFDEDMIIGGQFSGELKVRINKKDFDIGIVLYELLPDGQAFHLSYYLGRASYAKDMSSRQLLTPDTIETIPFQHTRMVSKRIRKGSRLIAVLNVNKNPFAQINYGTGKEVSDESIKDAGEPLQVDWFNDSYIDIPMELPPSRD